MIIWQSQVSIVICGWDEQRYFGWAFIDTPNDPTCMIDDDDDEDDENEGTDDEDDENTLPSDEASIELGIIPELCEDYFAADGDTGDAPGQMLDANQPIWNPRTYWLCIVEWRARRAVEEWVWVVYYMEFSMASWKDKHAAEWWNVAASRRSAWLQELYTRTSGMMDVLSKLRPVYQKTLRAWEMFHSIDGDQRLFADLIDEASISSLKNIRTQYFELLEIQHRFDLLDNLCKDLQTSVSKRVQTP